ncbi:SGNH/GDSL hydrolase family protein [Mumia sp. zg.B17]|uniref:SGNH/GDSL hydrolase family protein n=1 Tax=Mumia sp. zg.B17 TaxID=2855446 RepID=UPI001C6DDE9A|nr:SGNH/GDSL hydrolase family protein [Mumia sp. zg.B17]MBW9204593.1 SGNH/GDSL hydrolase family protein [Mumia sp. zg.B17]
MASEPVYHRYVALGDSFTEGVGDPDKSRPNGLRGWADRVAEVLATKSDSFGYANLAVRGRLLKPIIAEQLEPAVRLSPDLVTIYAGGNDLLRPKVDIDLLGDLYDAAIGRLAVTGTRVVVFTAYDLGYAPVLGKLRGRVAIYNEIVREIADKHRATLVDFWRFREYRDDRYWDTDRLHLSAQGHQQMAIHVLDTLGVSHTIKKPRLTTVTPLTKKAKRDADLLWAREFAVPWVQRRINGTSSGDTVKPKRPTLERI